jgi:hypothetical protein
MRSRIPSQLNRRVILPHRGDPWGEIGWDTPPRVFLLGRLLAAAIQELQRREPGVRPPPTGVDGDQTKVSTNGVAHVRALHRES